MESVVFFKIFSHALLRGETMKPLTIFGFITGTFIIVVSTIRWYFLWYDPSQAFMGAFIGLIILAGSWLHYLIMKIYEKLELVDKQINAINKFYMKEEWQ